MKKILSTCSLLISISAQAEYNWKAEQFADERDACSEALSETLVLSSFKDMINEANSKNRGSAQDPISKGFGIGLEAGIKAQSICTCIYLEIEKNTSYDAYVRSDWDASFLALEKDNLKACITNYKDPTKTINLFMKMLR